MSSNLGWRSTASLRPPYKEIPDLTFLPLISREGSPLAKPNRKPLGKEVSFPDSEISLPGKEAGWKRMENYGEE